MKRCRIALVAALWAAAFVAALAQTSSSALKLPAIAEGPFRPDWASLAACRTPEWFRDAKFGIWAHWGPQCEPEHGDWSARNMYIPSRGDVGGGELTFTRDQAGLHVTVPASLRGTIAFALRVRS